MRTIDPAYIALPSGNEDVQRFLTFYDRQVQFAISKLRNNWRWRQSDPEGFLARQEELKAQAKRCLLQINQDGTPMTYSGLWKELQNRFGWEFEDMEIDPGVDRMIPWAKEPHKLRYYQEDAAAALLCGRHCGIELPTGAGKSLIIEKVLKERPVKSLVITPSAAITDQLYKGFISSFGQRYVGKYGDGSKKSDKLFTVAVAQALTRLSEGDQAWRDFSQVRQFGWDEAHTTPAETFDKVCMGMLRPVPFRNFYSATMLRTDGAEMVLKGITGPIVYRKSFRELVDEKFLAKPRVRMIHVAGSSSSSRDVKQETRNQLYTNPRVCREAASIAAKMINQLGRQVVILVEEFKQFNLLKNYMTVPFDFVHGGASPDAKEFLEPRYHDCDIEKSVNDFNDGKLRCLIGTSAISTGVDLRPVGCLIYLQGGISEIKVRQAIGRGTRLVPGKEDFYVVDFCVYTSDAMERHAGERLGIYRDMTDDVMEVKA